MKFGVPYMAIFLWLVIAVIVFYWIVSRLRMKMIRNFAKEEVMAEISASISNQKRKLSIAIIIFSFFLIVFALMRPQWGFEWQEVKRKGLDIIIALDTSKSMLAEDVLPNRLQRAKLGIKDLIKKLHGDRIGLIAFSGTAFLQCPLTVDYNGFLLALDDVDITTMPIGGTAIAKAIYTACSSFEKGKKEEKILIVITDGEDLEGGLDRAIAKAKADGIRIFCVGIGAKEGELIPLPDEKGKIDFLKDIKGDLVRTRLVEEPLQKMALETGGMYVQAQGTELGLTVIYDEGLAKLEKQEFESKMEKRYYDRFQIPLLFAIVLLFVEPLIGDRKRKFKT